MLSRGAERGRNRRVVAALCAVLLVAGAAACGGDDEGGDGAAGGDDGSSTSRAVAETTSSSASTSSSTSTTSAPATPEEEVEAAYLRSWDVYAEAVRELDPSGLEESYAGDALAVVTREVQRRATERTPVRVDIDHDYTIQILEDGAGAIVHDRYKNRSVKLDPESGEPVEPPEETLENEIYQLRTDRGVWKVIVIARPE